MSSAAWSLKLVARVESFKVNDRVLVTPILPCFECDYCQQGNFTVNVKTIITWAHGPMVVLPSMLKRRSET